MTGIIARKPIATVLTALLLASLGPARAAAGTGKRPVFDDVKPRTRQFIGWSSAIKLTPAQEQLKTQALGAIPAPCCKEYSIATCCCPCNLAQSVWGLANYAVARLGYDAPRVRALVSDWLRVINPRGYTGNACYRGGCPRPFAANGCGGMKEDSVAF